MVVPVIRGMKAVRVAVAVEEPRVPAEVVTAEVVEVEATEETTRQDLAVALGGPTRILICSLIQ